MEEEKRDKQNSSEEEEEQVQKGLNDEGSEDAKNVSALLHNIKSKGTNSVRKQLSFISIVLLCSRAKELHYRRCRSI